MKDDYEYSEEYKDVYRNPNMEKQSAYTDEYCFRLDSFIDDRSKGRRR